MKRLVFKESGKFIGDYPLDWAPPKGSDLYDGLADGSISFVDIPQEELNAEAKKHRAFVIKAQLNDIDRRRMRPLAEGDTAKLEELNAEARALRAELQGL